MPFHDLDSSAIFKELGSSEKGLTEAEAENRLKLYGPNSISALNKRTIFAIIIDQFKNFLLIMLVLAALVSFLISHFVDGIAILSAVFLSVGFGFLLEFKADESIAALRLLQAPNAVVLRDGKTRVIDASMLVSGDIILLEEGSKIPADCRIIKEYDLEANEAPLTGESASVRKTSKKLQKETSLSEMGNMLFSGTFIVKGSGEALVVATGDNTEIGKIASSLSDITSEKTTLHKSIEEIGKKVSLVSILVVLLLFIIGFFQGREIGELFVLAVSLAVAAVPEGLLTVLTIISSVGINRMAKKNALVKKLSVVESLGTATILVVDKTGTLTEGKMSLVKVYYSNVTYEIEDFESLKILKYASLCNSARISEKGIVGDEIDKAILETSRKKDLDIAAIKNIKPLNFSSFDSIKKRMSGVFQLEKKILIVKGAPEVILDMCTKIEVESKTKNINKESSDSIRNELINLTSDGMRVLAVAYKEATEIEEENLIFLGLLAFNDPPRVQVQSTIETCRRASIKVLMLTGDNIHTAISIGMKIGLIKSSAEATEAKNLMHLQKNEFIRKLERLKLIARSTPANKLQVVQALIDSGENVIVTGDGVNDALALKKAQVGVVMGSGTDVSKEAGNLVLLDDNLSTLINAISYGRTVFSNIINFIRFQFTTNVAIFIMFVSSFIFSLPYMLNPIQILFINIVMDGPPALALGLEHGSNKVLDQKPRKIKSLLSKNIALSIILSGLFMVAITLSVYYYFLSNYSEKEALTASFLVFVFMQLFNSLNCRFEKESFYKEPASNPYIFLAFSAVALISVPLVYLPTFQPFFSTVSLGLVEFIAIILISSSILLIDEIKKKYLFLN